MIDTPEMIFFIYELPMENYSFFSQNFVYFSNGEKCWKCFSLCNKNPDMTISWPERTDFYGLMSEIKV